MSATLTDERFTGPEWTFEQKLDGIRMLAFKNRGNVRLLSRNQLPLNSSYARVVQAIAALSVRDCILDGEAAGGFGRLGDDDYYVFDILWLNGRDLTGLPLEERRKVLASLKLRPPIGRVPAIDGPEPWTRACAEGWEGVIAKRRDSVYEHRRSRAWLKMKCESAQEFVVGGFTNPRGARQGLGALLVGYFEGDDFVFAGKVGTGLDPAQLIEMRARLDSLEQPKPPFTKGKGLPRKDVHWVRPKVVVQVAFIEWTVHGKLRHPRLQRLRVDKAAKDVVREQP